MTDKQKRRLEQLKQQNAFFIKEQQYKSDILLQECLEKLKTFIIVDNLDEILRILNFFQIAFPMKYGKIDNTKLELNPISINDILSFNTIQKKIYFIIWDRGDVPIIKCKFENILTCIYDIIAVSFDTWIVSEDYLNVIEFYHEGTIVTNLIH